MSIKIFKINYLFSVVKLNNKKKALLKNMVWREGVTKKYSLERRGYQKNFW